MILEKPIMKVWNGMNRMESNLWFCDDSAERWGFYTIVNLFAKWQEPKEGPLSTMRNILGKRQTNN
jgi:hypothetical protein